MSAPTLLGVPVQFTLFGLMLLGVAAFHKRALTIALAGLAIILAYEPWSAASRPAMGPRRWAVT